MKFTKQRAKNLIALSLLGCLFTSLPTLVHAQDDEQANVWRVVEQFFAAFQQKDLRSVMALWSEKSPDFTTGRQIFQQTFTAHSKIEVKSLRPNKITVENDKATV